MPDDIPSEEIDMEEDNIQDEENIDDDLITNIEPSEEWTTWRNNFANEMYNEWRARI